jgi:hypothetical protein
MTLKPVPVLYALVFAAALLPPVSAADGPQPFPCSVAQLHPTQLAVGMQEVRDKAHKLSKMDGHELEKYEKDHPEPVVKGPGGALYIIDHHHLARALMEIGVDSTYCVSEADYTRLGAAAFWKQMESNKWVYMYDEYGEGPKPYSQLPATVAGLKDDPYRSLAGAVRDAGGYDKTSTPFAEFTWADFFRAKFTRQDLADDFDKCVKKGVKLAGSPAASGLPGYHP